MNTHFSLELVLDESELLRFYQVFEYLSELGNDGARIRSELAGYFTDGRSGGDKPEVVFETLIGTQNPGIDVYAPSANRVRIYDRDGMPNLRMLSQIIANVVPRALPLEFSFALIDRETHRYSGGLVVMTLTSTEILTVDSTAARRNGQALH